MRIWGTRDGIGHIPGFRRVPWEWNEYTEWIERKESLRKPEALKRKPEAWVGDCPFLADVKTWPQMLPVLVSTSLRIPSI